MADHVTCSVLSLRRGEPVQATASRVRRWLVVEQPGAWGRDALLESHLDPVVARSLHAHGRRHGVRVVLARRPGWEMAGPTRRVHLAHTDHAGGWLEHLDADEGALLGLDLAAIASPTAPGVGAAGPDSLILVCTNGRHDTCCADRGRPVVRALVAAGVADTWECSHIGGDRFAANIVHLPSGAYLGRVPPERAAAMVDDLTKGLVDLDHFRGRSCFSILVQAAEIAIRRELGERRLDALAYVDERAVDPDTMTARFRHGESLIDATVRRRPGPVVQLTCAENTGHTWSYDLVALQPVPSAVG